MQVLVSPLAGPGSVACRLVVRRFGHTRGAGSGMQGGALFLRAGLVAFRGARFECVEVGFMLWLVARRLGRACGDGL